MLVVWDWNGTLLDDMDVCLDTINGMLRRRGLPQIPDLDRYREIFTFPGRTYYALAGFDLEREPFADLAEEYMTGYRAASRSCGLVSGARETLAALDRMGMEQVLASASRQDDLERQVAEQGVRGAFSAVLGMADQLGGGKAGLAVGYLRREGVDPADVLFVGDTVHDLEVARQVGCRCVLIAGGHQSRARLEASGAAVLEHIRRLPAYLAGGGAEDR